jgi:hypothetical protein
MFDLKQLPGYVNDDGVQGYLMLITDHFTKYKWGTIMWGKNAQHVALYLFQVFSEIGTPERWHCDNGSEFENGMVAHCRVLLSLGNADGGLLPYTHGGVRYAQTHSLAWVSVHVVANMCGYYTHPYTHAQESKVSGPC